MIPESDFKPLDKGISYKDFLEKSKLLRLLEVDNRLELPWKQHKMFLDAQVGDPTHKLRFVKQSVVYG
jgi:hypothetical protein